MHLIRHAVRGLVVSLSAARTARARTRMLHGLLAQRLEALAHQGTMRQWLLLLMLLVWMLVLLLILRCVVFRPCEPECRVPPRIEPSPACDRPRQKVSDVLVVEEEVRVSRHALLQWIVSLLAAASSSSWSEVRRESRRSQDVRRFEIDRSIIVRREQIAPLSQGRGWEGT